MFFRIKKSGHRAYVQVVENKRFDGAVRQSVIANLGRADDLIASGALASLLASGAKFTDQVLLITTLASRAYEYCVTQFEYDHELDLIVDVLRRMPTMLQSGTVEGRSVWYLWNQTTAGENFCEKWNKHLEQAMAFFDWHDKVVADPKM